jgi:hypothetical protein
MKWTRERNVQDRFTPPTTANTETSEDASSAADIVGFGHDGVFTSLSHPFDLA